MVFSKQAVVLPGTAAFAGIGEDDQAIGELVVIIARHVDLEALLADIVELLIGILDRPDVALTEQGYVAAGMPFLENGGEETGCRRFDPTQYETYEKE